MSFSQILEIAGNLFSSLLKVEFISVAKMVASFNEPRDELTMRFRDLAGTVRIDFWASTDGERVRTLLA